MKQNTRIPKLPSPSPALASAIGLGSQLAVGMAVFAGLGYWLDHRQGGDGTAFTLSGIFLGLLYGGYEVWKVVRLLQAESKPTQGRRENP